MKFAHLADCHIGGWREGKLRDANARSFCLAIKTCLEEAVDFVLISGDLFNTAVPAIDSLRMAVEQLRRLKDAHIPIYIIAGSHDFSPSGKTMIEVLEHAGLVLNVARGEELADGRVKLKFTVDEKTGVKLTGMIGKKGGLEVGYYDYLAKEHLEQESGMKIFLFHSALAELKPKELEKMDAMPVSLLPANFAYYAGGHVHVVDHKSIGPYKNIVYPGPIFPNNFSEVEKLQQGSFVIVTDGAVKHVPLKVHPTVCIRVDANGKTPTDVSVLVKKELAKHELTNAIVTIRVAGQLGAGRPADVLWNDIFFDAYARNAYVVLRNTNALTSKELDVMLVKEASVEEVESALIQEHATQVKLKDEDVLLTKKVMNVLAAEKAEGERATDFEGRLSGELDRLFGG